MKRLGETKDITTCQGPLSFRPSTRVRGGGALAQGGLPFGAAGSRMTLAKKIRETKKEDGK